MSTTAISISLQTHATRIQEAHRACQDSYTNALMHAHDAGRLLAEAKAQLSHGEWTGWLAEHVGFSDRTARVYMQVAGAPELQDRQTSADLSIAAALKQMSKPQRATAEDVSQMLQNAGGSAPAPVRQPRAQTDDLWTASLQHRAEKVSVLLAGAIEALLDSQTKGLSSYSIAETLRSAAVEARHASVALDELAFNFEK